MTMPKRSECRCPCHNRPGTMMHIVPCCEPDNRSLADRYAKAIPGLGGEGEPPKIMIAITEQERSQVVDALRQADLPERGSKTTYQQVFQALMDDAAARLPPGTRYEIRLMGRPPFRRITVHSTDAMNQIEPWTDTPEQTAEHYRVGRYTTPKEATCPSPQVRTPSAGSSS